TCSVCKKTFSDAKGTKAITNVTVKATGHKLTKTAGKAATCTAEGNVEYYTCSVCKKTFSDAKGAQEITDVTVKTTGHIFGEWTVTTPATAAAAGVETRTCSKCGTKETRSIEKLKATPGDVNHDGAIGADDARLALRRSVDLEDYAEDSPEFLACDVNGDKTVGADDARLILRASVDLEDPTSWG
ncbi:MAG: dockerin type I repeat-containing protein, partial [Clostridia bacterium]|nr:dockerin type I repeat-containing protein [Clostridia bacterium]